MISPLTRLNLPGGAAGLTDAELLGLLLGDSPHAQAVLTTRIQRMGGLVRLWTADAPTLKCAGFSDMEVAQLLAAVELGHRALAPRQAGIRITEPVQVHALLWPLLACQTREHFVLLCLDADQIVVSLTTIAVGATGQVQVAPADIYQCALRHQAAAIVVAHNHPSGDPRPSVQDVEATLRLADAADVLEIPLLDHVIVAARGYASLAELARLPGCGGQRP